MLRCPYNPFHKAEFIEMAGVRVIIKAIPDIGESEFYKTSSDLYTRFVSSLTIKSHQLQQYLNILFHFSCGIKNI